jgi:large subunit ribosomal protein L28
VGLDSGWEPPAASGTLVRLVRHCLLDACSFLNPRSYPVSSVCDVCGKGPGFGHNVPWSKKKTKRRWSPNIQTVRTPAGGGTTKKLKVCTSCIKAGKVVRA